MKYKDFDQDVEQKLDAIRNATAAFQKTRDTMEEEIRREWRSRVDVAEMAVANAVMSIKPDIDSRRVTVKAVQRAAKKLNYDKWLEFLNKWDYLTPTAQIAEPEQGFRVTELVGYRDYGYVAARITFSDGTVIDVPVYMLLTKYEEGLVPEVVFLTPEQLAAIRAFVSAGESETWVAQSAPREGEVGTEAEVDAAIAKSPSPEYAPKKKNLHEYIFEHLDREEAGLNAHE